MSPYTISPNPENSNCSPDGYDPGGKGTTFWSSEDITIPPSGNYTWTFTDTKPCCYANDAGTQVCLLVYDIVTTQYSPDCVFIGFHLNGYNVGATVHSKIANHNVTEAFDLVNSQHYNSGGQNSIMFVNGSTYTPVQIKNFRIIRAYAIYGLNQSLPCIDPPDDPATGNLDYSRQDFPCNYDSYGDRVSAISYQTNKDAVAPILPNGGFVEWTFENPDTPDTANYLDRIACLFNFNQLDRPLDLSEEDTHYRISVNDVNIADYYHGGVVPFWTSQFPTVDLAKFPAYNDSPGATNTVKLENLGNVPLTLYNGDGGGVDIYRFHKAKNICQDDFIESSNQYSFFWDTIQLNGGVVDRVNNQLQVSVTSGSGWRQAGKVTKHACDTQAFYPGTSQQGFETAIDVTSIGSLTEMNLLVSSDHRTDIDPASSSNNWYRIMKNGANSTVLVQRMLSSSLLNAFSTQWVSSTGQLKIKASAGSIAFYENGLLRYAEPFALPSNKCYIYPYTSSNTNGTGTFDNFSTKPSEIVRDDFNDGNYNGWTVDSGSWSVSNGKLQSSQYGSHIHYNQAFYSPNRHVAADIQTISSGGTAYVPFLMVNEVNGSNMVYADLRTDGKIELVLFYGGYPTNWQVQTGLSSYNSNRIAVTIVGTNAKVWVNGQLYIDVTNGNFANLYNGHVGLWTYNSTGSLDNIAVFSQ